MAKKKSKSSKDMTLDIIMAEYNQAAGMTVVGPLSEFDLSLEAIPTGNLMLDVTTGVGGFALGKMYEVAGDKASGYFVQIKKYYMWILRMLLLQLC